MSESFTEYLAESALKTISQQYTRHQTSAKRNNYLDNTQHKSKTGSHFVSKMKEFGNKIPKNQSSYLRNSLIMLESRKIQFMQAGKYQNAIKVNKQINRAKSQLTKVEWKQLQSRIMRQSKSIKKAYNNEKIILQKAWSQFTEKVQGEQLQKINNFYLSKHKQVKQSQRTLSKKSQSLTNKSKQLIDLQKQQKYYMMKGDIRQLSYIKKQIKIEKEKTKKQRQKTIEKWTEVQNDLIGKIQSKKYSILVNKLQQKKIDQEILYFQQKKRLKQKYKNILNQLRHQQKMTLNFVNRRMETNYQ